MNADGKLKYEYDKWREKSLTFANRIKKSKFPRKCGLKYISVLMGT